MAHLRNRRFTSMRPRTLQLRYPPSPQHHTNSDPTASVAHIKYESFEHPYPTVVNLWDGISISLQRFFSSYYSSSPPLASKLVTMTEGQNSFPAQVYHLAETPPLCMSSIGISPITVLCSVLPRQPLHRMGPVTASRSLLSVKHFVYQQPLMQTTNWELEMNSLLVMSTPDLLDSFPTRQAPSVSISGAKR